MTFWIISFGAAVLCSVSAGFAAGRFRRYPRAQLSEPRRCNRIHCRAWIHLECGSGYCAEHHALWCSEACMPAICKHCKHPWKEHAPPKCLFASTAYEREF